MAETVLGVIGGTGLYELDGLTDIETVTTHTPFGAPSTPITVGRLGDVKLCFIARHGVGHRFLPSEVPYQANIFALKQLGVTWCLGIGAVGSLQEELEPGQLVVPDQFIDRTKDRPSTFFGDGVVAHVSFGSPFCPTLRRVLYEHASEIAAAANAKCHDGGTYVCMEGPAFSTRAESNLYRSWGGSVIGMTNLTEAKLAREAEIAYASLALVTDYDCWRSDSDEVDIEELLKTLSGNAALAKDVIKKVATGIVSEEPSALAAEALKFAIITAPDAIPPAKKRTLAPLIGKYIKTD